MKQHRILYTIIAALLIIGWVIRWNNRTESVSAFSQNNASVAAPDTNYTIKPSLHLKDSVYPYHFEAAFIDGTTITQGKKTFQFHKKYIGHLKCPTGIMIACDPINLFNVESLKEQFPIGNFPVQVALENSNGYDRVAFSRICFSDKPVKKWLPAKTKDETPADTTMLRCFTVDAGLAMFTDKAASTKFNLYGEEEIQKFWKYAENAASKPGYFYDVDNNNMVCFASGYGDGCYTPYIGYDEDGKICRLLIDFDFVLWYNKWIPDNG